ncbi:PUA-like domain-containing protein [Glomus cerebriforme]|uniref:PUA-like domain-containing protein n=1 Tax=Glomus cerebriforme TaxID=658196 RepID=A0A397TGL1_9GLOM|nr:PUA-like domain-containing protein [Glomus cerebriforme]
MQKNLHKNMSKIVKSQGLNLQVEFSSVNEQNDKSTESVKLKGKRTSEYEIHPMLDKRTKVINSLESMNEQIENLQYWLMKAEPDSRIVKGKDVKFSINDLADMPDGVSQWDGVRNYEARNIMKDKMKIGDKVLFYHSNCKTPGIAGLAEIVKEAYPDYTAFDEFHPYYDPKSNKDNPRWFMVDVKFVRKFKRLITLKELQTHRDKLKDMTLLSRGRLSIQPVKKEHYRFILELENQ